MKYVYNKCMTSCPYNFVSTSSSLFWLKIKLEVTIFSGISRELNNTKLHDLSPEKSIKLHVSMDLIVIFCWRHSNIQNIYCNKVKYVFFKILSSVLILHMTFISHMANFSKTLEWHIVLIMKFPFSSIQTVPAYGLQDNIRNAKSLVFYIVIVYWSLVFFCFFFCHGHASMYLTNEFERPFVLSTSRLEQFHNYLHFLLKLIW